jgi:outer membrane protein OmpA-like peptidoglycan-associated protein
MGFGATARTRCSRHMLFRVGVLLLGTSALYGPVSAQAPAKKDPLSLKEVLGKAQTEAETKAVEDLVDKLKGSSRKAPPPAPAPPATAGAPDGPDRRASKEAATPRTLPPSGDGTPVPPGDAPAASPGAKVAAPVTPKEAPPAAQPTPDAAIESAEKKQKPSVDLEVLFAYKSAEITSEAAAALMPLGRALRDARLADDAFLIAGHTDAKGGADYNLELSQRRAESVRQFLITNFGIDASKLVAKGYGLQRLKNAARPLAAENRRVQIVNLSKDK